MAEAGYASHGALLCENPDHPSSKPAEEAEELGACNLPMAEAAQKLSDVPQPTCSSSVMPEQALTSYSKKNLHAETVAPPGACNLQAADYQSADAAQACHSAVLYGAAAVAAHSDADGGNASGEVPNRNRTDPSPSKQG